MEIQYCEVVFEGKKTVFAISNPIDEVQSYSARGAFYELDFLLMQRVLIPLEGLTVIDVGSNIGNNAFFYAQHTPARRVVCFEPCPDARALLLAGIEKNGFAAKIDTQFLQFGCGSHRCQKWLSEVAWYNLGGASLRDEPSDQPLPVSVVPLDDLFASEPISLIKIDVEGMELDVLKGAEKTIEFSRPAIAIEVRNENISEFWAWCDKQGYSPINEFRMYWDAANYVCVSKRNRRPTKELSDAIKEHWTAEIMRRKAEASK